MHYRPIYYTAALHQYTMCMVCIDCVCAPPKFYHLCTMLFPELCPMCECVHYSQNYAGIIGTSLHRSS